jgi:hypothetical protein
MLLKRGSTLLAPVFIAIALFNDERRLYLRRLLELVIFGVVFFFLQDFLMGGDLHLADNGQARAPIRRDHPDQGRLERDNSFPSEGKCY